MAARKVIDYLLERKLCTDLKDAVTCIKDGCVSWANQYPFIYGCGPLVHLVTDTNETVYPFDLITLSVKNRGKTKIYKPSFEGKYLQVRRYDNGPHEWEVVERANAIVAVPVLDGTDIVLVQVYRPAISQYLFELPAGMMEHWESAPDTALRELEEETGYVAGQVRYLWSSYSSPGYSTEKAHFYLCTSLSYTQPKTDPEEQIIAVTIPIEQAFQMVRNGKIQDMKTIAGISYLQTFMKEGLCQNSLSAN